MSDFQFLDRLCFAVWGREVKVFSQMLPLKSRFKPVPHLSRNIFNRNHRRFDEFASAHTLTKTKSAINNFFRISVNKALFIKYWSKVRFIIPRLVINCPFFFVKKREITTTKSPLVRFRYLIQVVCDCSIRLCSMLTCPSHVML